MTLTFTTGVRCDTIMTCVCV